MRSMYRFEFNGRWWLVSPEGLKEPLTHPMETPEGREEIRLAMVRIKNKLFAQTK